MEERDIKEMFTYPAEILPDNARTAAIMKERAEKEEQERQKREEIRALRDQEEKKKK